MSIKIFIKRKTSAGKGYANQIRLSIKTLVTSKFLFLNFMPVNCVRCEVVFVRQNTQIKYHFKNLLKKFEKIFELFWKYSTSSYQFLKYIFIYILYIYIHTYTYVYLHIYIYLSWNGWLTKVVVWDFVSPCQS